MRDRPDKTIEAGQLNGLHWTVTVRGGQILMEHYGAGDDFSRGTSLGPGSVRAADAAQRPVGRQAVTALL